MPVFKAYLTVIRKILPSLIIYVAIFIAMATLFIQMAGTSEPTGFKTYMNNVVIRTDETSVLIDSLKEYLEENVNIVVIQDKKDSLEDALFFGKVDDVLTIPAGFTESVMSGKNDVLIDHASSTLSGGSISVDLLIGRYLDLAGLYVLNIPGIDQGTLTRSVSGDLQESAQITVETTKEQITTGGLGDTFRYMAYSIMAVLIMGITSIMMAFNSPEVAKRNLCAPISPARMSGLLFAGNAVFTVAVWLVLCLFAFLLSGRPAFGTGTLLLYLNTLVFAIAAMSIAFLAGRFIKSQIAQAAVANVVSLGISFLSGVFVPQYLLGDTVQKISSFTPGYWYVKAVDSIGKLSVYSAENLKPIFSDMLIQLGFAAACLIVAMVAAKQKKQTLQSCF